MKLILASRSPRRSDLLASAGVSFDVMAEDTEELLDASLSPRELCEVNAALKANAVFCKYPESVVLGADTLVFLDGTPLGKPADLEEARETLRFLSGRTHRVCTGVCLRHPAGERLFSVITEVTFQALTESRIEDYISRVNVMDKAGSYACQEHGELIIERIDGDLNNVIGLPLEKVLEELSSLDVQ